ncbi:MAG: hypothetical protein FJX35_18580 [Alphaproteobacteria bacterium]|nr:hypothetical protein [Alphaproteobacteria bacterium]
MPPIVAGLSALALACHTVPAWAHTSDRAFVMLLPTGYYNVGGTFAVLASFLVLALIPATQIRRLAMARVVLFELPVVPTTAISGASFAILVILVAAGWFGATDPLANPLPLTVWTLWWVGFTIAQAVFGHLWAALNPWLAPYRLLRRLFATPGKRPLAYPDWLGHWPAVIGFAAFAWFELIDPAPDNAARLATVATLYTLATLAGMWLFGERDWLAQAECFSVFFGFVARLSPLQVGDVEAEPSGRRMVVLRWPGAALVQIGALPVSATLFVLLTLATVSFDGLSKTFLWLSLGGINPLEFPGRSAMIERNTFGLIAGWVALAAVFALAVVLGAAHAGRGSEARSDLGAFALTILPISLGYHLAHYLTTLLVNGQYAVRSFNDPFALGWNLLGLSGRHPHVSFLADYHAVAAIWAAQAASVVLGHVLAILLAHMVAIERYGTTRGALISQLPLAVLMIVYTWFGLWLLATPTAG